MAPFEMLIPSTTKATVYLSKSCVFGRTIPTNYAIEYSVPVQSSMCTYSDEMRTNSNWLPYPEISHCWTSRASFFLGGGESSVEVKSLVEEVEGIVPCRHIGEEREGCTTSSQPAFR